MTSDPHVSPERPRTGHLPGEPPAVPPATLPSIPDDTAVTADPTPPAAQVSPVKFTRAAALWSALIVGFLVLIVLLVFILQNTGSATIHFFTWEWNLPVGVAILFAAVCGGLLTVAVGTVRIYQLRRATKKALKAMR
ncbi:MAG: DUF1049 domain-containing protein [Actinobacteria bacterium]|nr:DUF1049 domain-containing protein [Actinomycetota bacterium]